ncbi:MAG: hypothetical protein EA396_13540 [Anaerolineaceae bacterium]|nr:MAG: hypothetical protein EA396_13540 [Anaerolineaceae bacterium]
MKFIGTIQQVQIQRTPLKIGEKPNKVYDVTPIMVVDALRLTPSGGVGLTADGGEFLDTHHIQHPQSRNRRNANGISIGFMSNYRQMRQRFGDHLFDGSAGENIIVDAVPDFSPDDLTSGLLIETPAGSVQLCNIKPAAPCDAFSRYCANRQVGGEELKAILQFLSDGMRGYYATLAPTEAGMLTVSTGDKIYALSATNDDLTGA